MGTSYSLIGRGRRNQRDKSLENSGRFLVGFTYTQYLVNTYNVGHIPEQKSIFPIPFWNGRRVSSSQIDPLNLSPVFLSIFPWKRVCLLVNWDEQKTLQEASFPKRFNCNRLGTEMWQRRVLWGLVRTEVTFLSHSRREKNVWQWEVTRNKTPELDAESGPVRGSFTDERLCAGSQLEACLLLVQPSSTVLLLDDGYMVSLCSDFCFWKTFLNF